jgi:flagellar basal-body rod protein FlgC
VNIGASLSGLFAAQTRFDVAANDVANANTAGYRQARADLAEATPGVRVEQISRPGQEGSPAEAPSDVSLAEEVTEIVAAKHMYGANAQVLRSMLETQGTLFDTRA